MIREPGDEAIYVRIKELVHNNFVMSLVIGV